MEQQSNGQFPRSLKKADERFIALQSQLEAFKLETDHLQESLSEADKRKELGGSLFVAGSGLLLLTMISFPFLSLLISLVLIILGVIFHFYGKSDKKEMQKKIEEANVQVSRIEEELKSLE